MHIPDGYLSLQTSLPALGIMVPVWASAVKKMKKVLDNRQLPFISLCAAFSFVIMMFNVPLGASSVHTVGAVFIAILLGPWAACISVSVALIIQAFVFGDGGVISLGVNCFNMAFAMPFTGYYIYRLIEGKSELLSRRSTVGIFTGGYAGINIAAFLTAVEVGIQPLLFKTAVGLPKYGFLPLSVSVPAIMTEHLFVAGPLEGVVTVSAIAYLLKFAPHLLGNVSMENKTASRSNSFLSRYRYLITGLLVLVFLTPVGLIASGTAWGEWGMEQVREMAGFVPEGMKNLSGMWESVMPDYSIPGVGNGFLGSAAGYVISAVAGVILIILVMLLTGRFILGKNQSEETTGHKDANLHDFSEIPSWMLQIDELSSRKKGRNSNAFLRQTLAGISRVIQDEVLAERFAGRNGLIQGIDPRVKLVTVLLYMVYAGFTGRFITLAMLVVVSAVFVWSSKLNLVSYARRVWLILPVILLIISLPVTLNLFIHGHPALYVFKGLDTNGWFIPVPSDIYFTKEGLTAAVKIAFRSGVSLSFIYVLIMTTRWSSVTRALTSLKIPGLFVSILDMTYRYIFVLAKTAIEIFEARLLRTVGKIKGRENRQFVSGSIGSLFIKSNYLSEEIYNSMLCRGYDGEMVSVEDFKLKHIDFLWIAVNLLVLIILFMGEMPIGK